jgi:hypothetical protein
VRGVGVGVKNIGQGVGVRCETKARGGGKECWEGGWLRIIGLHGSIGHGVGVR